jgi:hypothetical protein
MEAHSRTGGMNLSLSKLSLSLHPQAGAPGDTYARSGAVLQDTAVIRRCRRRSPLPARLVRSRMVLTVTLLTPLLQSHLDPFDLFRSLSLHVLPPWSLGHRFGAVAAPCGLRASAFSRLLPQDELGSPSTKCSPGLGSSAPRALRVVCPERHREQKRRSKSHVSESSHSHWIPWQGRRGQNHPQQRILHRAVVGHQA